MKAIMIVGTTSHAGKSLLTAALCRILFRQGWRVTPFKGQNMSLNAYAVLRGGEMSYAQAVQAWAADVEPRVEMNPILLKPQGDMTSQVILRGKVAGRVSAADYYEQFFEAGWQAITESLEKLKQEYELIICEGAGSPAEINLKHRDLTNMRVAKYLNAPTILVVDIDRGGAFAHVIGTLELLEPEERALVKGIVINKFRGQRTLLQSGVDWLENRTGIPVLGVIPWIEHIFPAEDSLDLLEHQPQSRRKPEVKISVVRFPRISNFTDFDPLVAEPTVAVQYLDLQDSLGHPDAVILPGSKTTIADLEALRKSGMDQAIQAYAAAGGTVLGICGGFQMLGQHIIDTEANEGWSGTFPGLGLLPIRTLITEQKIARRRITNSAFPQSGLPITGYEIHQGRSQIIEPDPPLPTPTYHPLFEDVSLGIVDANQGVWGTYLHGLFDNGPWRRTWLNYLRRQRGLGTLPTGIANYQEQRNAMFDALADTVAMHLDLSPILEAEG